MTAQSPRAVETLMVGDLIRTMDHGNQPIQWIGRREVSVLSDRLPVRIKAGSFGAGQPGRDLVVSPQHRILVQAESGRVLVAAKQLLPLKGVGPVRGRRKVVYFHLLMRRHEVVFAEGLPTESFLPGPEALRSVSVAQRLEVMRLGLGAMTPARPIAKGKTRDRVVARLVGMQQAQAQDHACVFA